MIWARISFSIPARVVYHYFPMFSEMYDLRRPGAPALPKIWLYQYARYNVQNRGEERPCASLTTSLAGADSCDSRITGLLAEQGSCVSRITLGGCSGVSWITGLRKGKQRRRCSGTVQPPGIGPAARSKAAKNTKDNEHLRPAGLRMSANHWEIMKTHSASYEWNS